MRKFDAHLESQLADGFPKDGISVLVRGTSLVDLIKCGMTVHAEIPPIFTGHVATEAILNKINLLESVESISGSQPLYFH